MLDAEGSRALEEPVHGRAVEVPRPSETVRLRHPREQFEIDLLRQPPERAVAHRRWGLPEHSRLQVMSHDAEHGGAALGRLRQPAKGPDAGRLARAVGSEEPEDLASTDLEAHVVESPHGLEVLDKAIGIYHV